MSRSARTNLLLLVLALAGAAVHAQERWIPVRNDDYGMSVNTSNRTICLPESVRTNTVLLMPFDRQKTAGTYYDYSTLKNDGSQGTAGSRPTWTATWGGAYDFASQFFSVADHARLSFGNGTTDKPFSIVYWAIMDDATSFRAVQKLIATTSGNAEWSFGGNPSDKLQMFICDDTTAVYILQAADATMTADQGARVCYGVTYSGNKATSGIKLYRNGVSYASTGASAGSYGGMHDTSATVDVGAFNRTGTASFADGRIEFVAIFDKELSATEMLQVYQGTK